MSTVEGTGGFEFRRTLLAIALALTVAAIAVGTWVLGSGADPAEQQFRPVVADVSTPGRAQPPLPVAPLPEAAEDAPTG
jgi:heme A synthase